ncbi:MAG: AAA family ATPase [Acidimicrobiales bacterium]
MIPREAIEWVWPGRIPAGKLTVVEGDPATAKSTMSIDLAARVTCGSSWPDGEVGRSPAAVLLLSAEDGWGDTIRPRLEAAGADLERCVCVAAREVDGEHGPVLRPVVLPDDIGWIARLIEDSGAAMVVVDVLAAYLSDRIDSHKDQSVRRLLAHLAVAAARTRATVILIRHHNKAPGAPALYRGGGSIGIIAAARAAYAVIRDPDDADHRLVATVKSNLAAEAPTWGYSLVDVPELGVARVDWDAEADRRSASELLAGSQSSALGEAVVWLTAWRAEHPGGVSAAELLAAATEAGIAPATLHRARKQLGLRTRKTAEGWVID